MIQQFYPLEMVCVGPKMLQLIDSQCCETVVSSWATLATEEQPGKQHWCGGVCSNDY